MIALLSFFLTTLGSFTFNLNFRGLKSISQYSKKFLTVIIRCFNVSAETGFVFTDFYDPQIVYTHKINKYSQIFFVNLVLGSIRKFYRKGIDPRKFTVINEYIHGILIYHLIYHSQ